MRIIFCNITYLRFYDGRTIGELMPESGGRFVKENQDAHEKWNFLNYDGRCYGYVQLGGEQMHIERLEGTHLSESETQDVTVVWCAEHPEAGTVVCGWYEHAKAYREIQLSKCTPLTGLDRCYWFDTEAENAYLLPENERTFLVDRSAQTGTGHGFGRSNIWYAESEYAKTVQIPKLVTFMDDHRGSRINTQTSEFLQPVDLPDLTAEEMKEYEDSEGEYTPKLLNYAYRGYANHPGDDVAYDIANSLKQMHQYKLALPWYERVLEMCPEDKNTEGELIYVYEQNGLYDKASVLAQKILSETNPSERDLIDELLAILADCEYFSGRIDDAIQYLRRIVSGSRNGELIQYTKQLIKTWGEQQI